MPEPRRGPGERRPPAAEAGQMLGVGLQFAASIVLFLLLGQWLDERLGTGPWLLLVGVMLGAGGGFYSLYRQLTAAQRRREEDRRPEGGE